MHSANEGYVPSLQPSLTDSNIPANVKLSSVRQEVTSYTRNSKTDSVSRCPCGPPRAHVNPLHNARFPRLRSREAPVTSQERAPQYEQTSPPRCTRSLEPMDAQTPCMCVKRGASANRAIQISPIRRLRFTVNFTDCRLMRSVSALEPEATRKRCPSIMMEVVWR
jgi:hypothetical protein